MEKVYGGIEAGGTKFVCIIATGPDDLRAEIVFPTTTPDETIKQAVGFFNSYSGTDPLAAVGVASFGPLNLDSNSPEYGYITKTPKSGWENTDILGMVKSALGLPVAIDTDVNGAALAEYLWGVGKGIDNLVYITVGTGIGGGGMVNGELIHGLVHPEMGHVRVPHDREKDPFEGCCPYHGDCLEGLASGKAVVEKETSGFVKIFADAHSDKILGATIYGPSACELIHEICVAMRAGFSACELSQVIHAHPTLSEAVREAAESVAGKAIHIL